MQSAYDTSGNMQGNPLASFGGQAFGPWFNNLFGGMSPFWQQYGLGGFGGMGASGMGAMGGMGGPMGAGSQMSPWYSMLMHSVMNSAGAPSGGAGSPTGSSGGQGLMGAPTGQGTMGIFPPAGTMGQGGMGNPLMGQGGSQYANPLMGQGGMMGINPPAGTIGQGQEMMGLGTLLGAMPNLGNNFPYGR